MRFPTWKEVESDPEFQSLEPTKKKEYFGKWSKTAVDRAMQQGLYRDNDFASGFTGWYNQKAKEYGEEEEVGDFQQLSAKYKTPKEVGVFEGISNAARNAFASSQQALAVTGGVTPEEAKEISKIEFEKNARQVSPDYKEYQEAQGFDAVKAFARNPFEVTTNIVAEGLAGSLPALGAGLAAGGVGAAVAAPTVVGAPVGFLAGQVAGTFAGSLATEYGSKVLEELQGAGMDINNPDSITDFFSRQELVDAAKDKALKRGVPIAAFDALSAGIGGKVGAITKAAFKTKPREAVAEMAVQAALGGGGEVVGSLAAGDKIDPKAVFAEVVGEVGPGAAEIGVGKIQQTFAERRKQEQIKRAAKVSQDLENNNAPLTADALKATVAKNAVEEEKATIEETDTALAEEVAKFAPPEDAITKQELKTQYSALSPEDLTDTEATFRERLDDEDPEMRTFAQNALDAIAEVRAEQVTPAPTVTPPVEAGVAPAPVAVEPEVAPVVAPPTEAIPPTEVAPALPAEAAPPEVVEPTAVAPTPTIEPTPAEPTPAPAEVETAASLSRVADNTATDEEVVRLARQGLVNIQEGQSVITPRGEEVMQRGGAPLPRLTPEERTAEVAAAPTPAAIVEQAPAPAPAVILKLGTTFADTERVDSTVEEVQQLGEVNPLNEKQTIINNVRVEVERQGNNLNIKDITSPEQGLGRGTQALQSILNVADKNQVSVVVTPKQTGATTKKQLRKWYSDNGFIDYTQGRMIRQPQPVPTPTPAEIAETPAPTPVTTPPVTEAVTPAAAAPTPAAPAEAAPVGIAVGNRVKTKTTPQSFVVEEVLPQSAREAELGEQYYSIRNERTGETQVVESNDISPIKGKRTRKISPVRAEEKYTPVPEADRYTFREASGRAIRFFGGEKPENFVIVNNSTDPDYEFKAGYDPETGEIILNRAYIQRGENIEDILTHELGHYIYSDPQFQADFQDFLESMPDEARAEIDRIVNEGYNKETNEVQIEEREVMAFTSLIRRTKRGLTAWEKLKDTIKKIINRFLGTNITLSDQGAMAVFNVGYKRFKSGERIIREMKEGTLRTAPEGMTQMDRDYLAAVERGDMETAQRMVDEAANVDLKTIQDKWEKDGVSSFAYTSRGDITLSEIRVPKEQRGRGVGSAKMRELLAFAQKHKMRVLLTPSTDFGASSKSRLESFYRNLGFEKNAGKNKDYGTRETMIWRPVGYDKSADPVTYDDAGNVIPLSQRFRATSPDIRRMAPEPAPALEAVVEEAPAERPKRRTKMQNIASISETIKIAKTKLTEDEMTALKTRIESEARRADKRTQKEFAKDVTQYLRELTIRGKVRSPQLRAITSKAMQTQFDNDASIRNFLNYANKVIENANYEKDISGALSTIKRAKQLSKGKKGSSRIRHRLAELARFNPRDIEPESMEPKRIEIDGEIVLEKPISVAEYTAVLKEYMGSLGPVTEEGFRVIPEAEIVDFLERMAAQYDANVEERRKAAFAKKIQQALENKALLPSELESLTKDSPEEYEQNLKKKQEDKRLKIENAITDLAMDAQSALVTYQPPEMTADKKEVLDFMRAVNVGDIPAGERKEFVLIANNILVNNDFSGSKKFTSIAKGQIGAMKAAEDAKSVKRNDAMLTFLDGYISEKLTRAINLSIQSIADTFRNIAGKEGAPRLLFLMGMGDLARGQATANKLNDEIANGIRDRYTQIEEETGQQISDKQGMFSMGVAGTLIQIQPDETEAEGISRIRKLILENIAVMENSPLLEDRRNVQFVKKALAEVDADTVDGVLENLNRLHPANYKALDFLMNTVLPEQKETLKEHDELFNNQTDNYNNPFYLPIRYRRTMVPVRTPEDIITSIYGGTPTPKQSANTIKRQKYSALPRDADGAPMLFDFNLTKNVLDSLSSQITAAYTNPYWQQIVSFLKAPPASDAVGGTRNLSFVNERLGKLAQSRTRRAYEMDGVSRILDTVANVSRRLGIGLALGGYGQFIKQLPDQLMTTLVNVKDPQLMSESMADLLSGRANAVLQQFSIGERGEIAGGTTWTNQMEGNFDKVRRFINDGNWVKAADAFERFNNVWLFALKKSDYLAAGSGWLAYYRKYLKDKGAEFNNWDEEAALLQEDNQLRIEAALYAEQMVDMYQGSSDPTKMATLSQRGQNGWENLAKTIFIPFFSFVIQQRSRIFSDARDVAFGDSDQKKSGASGLAGTLLGILAFHTARRFALPAIAGVGASAIYALLGVDMDEPDEEKQKEEANRIWRQFSGEVLSNIFFGGFGDFTEKKFIDSINYASYLIEAQIGNENVLNDKGELISFDKYQKERSPLYRYTGPGSENNLGMLDIMPGQIGELKKRIEEMTSEELAESLTPEERRVLFVAGLSEWLYTMRLNDADIARMIRRMNKDVIEQAEEREKARKRLQEIYQ